MNFPTYFLYIYLILFFIFFLAYIRFKVSSSKYWSKRNVQHLEPIFLIGNIWRANLTENLVFIMRKWYLTHKNKKILGFWMFSTPAIMVSDLNIIKRIFIKDFNTFRDRGFELDTGRDPLNGNLFMLNGKKWRNLRVKLTPTFTSGKMKLMFPMMVKCGEQLQNYLQKEIADKDIVEVKDVLARYTTDVISSCAFGIETNSLQNPNSEFREFGKKAFNTSFLMIIASILYGIYPPLLKLLGIHLIPKDTSDFFINVVRDGIEYRIAKNITRNDFLQLIIQLMKVGKVADVDRAGLEEIDQEEIYQKFSLNEAAAQCFVFFIAGFETSSTAMAFCLYELALNPEVQDKLHKEIDEAMEKTNNEITYDGLNEMEYLDMVVQETLRKYPPLGNLQRKCTNEYYIEEEGITIGKGAYVIVPVLGIHYDPDIYPNPEKFDPYRFSEEEKSKRDPFAYLPFGEGPRNCIGNRFGLLQVKVGLISFLRECTVSVSKETQIPMQYHKQTFILTPKGGIHLRITKRV